MVSHLVMWNYEKEYQEGLMNFKNKGDPLHRFKTNEVRQFHGSPQQFFYDCEYHEFEEEGIIGTQTNIDTGCKRQLRRWKHWKHAREYD